MKWNYLTQKNWVIYTHQVHTGDPIFLLKLKSVNNIFCPYFTSNGTKAMRFNFNGAKNTLAAVKIYYSTEKGQIGELYIVHYKDAQKIWKKTLTKYNPYILDKPKTWTGYNSL